MVALQTLPDVAAHTILPDLPRQKAMLRVRFGDEVWECPKILDALYRTNDLYFDRVSQIRMPKWSQGRIAPVGDAAYAPKTWWGLFQRNQVIRATAVPGIAARIRQRYRR